MEAQPKGGKGKRANYKTLVMRVPLPLQAEVKRLIEEFHRENEKYLALPLVGHWYEVLGVAPTASEEEVRGAWRMLSKLYHPDTNLKTDADLRIKAINRAYEEFKKAPEAL
jgi:DnaJ-domain-containing protein 1